MSTKKPHNIDDIIQYFRCARDELMESVNFRTNRNGYINTMVLSICAISISILTLKISFLQQFKHLQILQLILGVLILGIHTFLIYLIINNIKSNKVIQNGVNEYIIYTKTIKGLYAIKFYSDIDHHKKLFDIALPINEYYQKIELELERLIK